MGEARRKKHQAQQQTPPLKHEPGDAQMVLQSADAFRACSRPFCEKMMSLQKQEAMDEARKNLGEMIAAATNLAFAVELYMKALRIIYRQGPRFTHNLGKLYADLPAELRRRIISARTRAA